MDAQFITLLTVIAGFGFQYFREGRLIRLQMQREERQHAWEIEARTAGLLLTTNTAKQLAAHTSATATTLAAHTDVVSQRLEGLIVENTAISTDAFHEANTVNLKLQALGLEHNQILKDAITAVNADVVDRNHGAAQKVAASLQQIAANTTPTKEEPHGPA